MFGLAKKHYCVDCKVLVKQTLLIAEDQKVEYQEFQDGLRCKSCAEKYKARISP
jgi:methionyl-tRNA synthetase